MMKWPKEVKAHMNMTEEAKADDDLVEVIYACMDGNVYFLNLKTGEKQEILYIWDIPLREPVLWIQEVIRSCMSAGYNSDEGTARVLL